MPYQHKPDSGTLFINDRKEQPTHSDWTGTALINGVEYWVNEWNVTTDRDGNPLSKDKYRKNLRFKPKQQQQRPITQRNDSPMDDPVPYDDALPF